MKSFLGGRLKDWPVPTGLVWLMTEISEAKGRQQLYTRQSPQVLRALKEAALIQSTESSNRIEGVTVAPRRLKPLVFGKTRPKDRSEQEIEGYRKALTLIHTRASALPLDPATCLKLHGIIQAGAGDAGHWKRLDNEITETRAGEPPRVRFVPVSAKQTARAMEHLCRSYAHAVDQERVPALVAVAAFVLDFLCIHPFRDGNGRVSRLLTLLALYHHGFEVGRYISLERLVEDNKEDYYRALKDSSEGWHEGGQELVPWATFFLSILRSAYVEFEQRAGQLKDARGAKTEMLLAAILELPGEFAIGELRRAVPGAGIDLIRQLLRKEQKAGRLTLVAQGRNARWKRN